MTRLPPPKLLHRLALALTMSLALGSLLLLGINPTVEGETPAAGENHARTTSTLPTDLSILTISRRPLYQRYCLDYSRNLPELCPGTEHDQRFPQPGELVTFTARIANQGDLPTPHHTLHLAARRRHPDDRLAASPRCGRGAHRDLGMVMANRRSHRHPANSNPGRRGDRLQQHPRPSHRRPLPGHPRTPGLHRSLSPATQSGRFLFLSRLVTGAVYADEPTPGSRPFIPTPPTASLTVSASTSSPSPKTSRATSSSATPASTDAGPSVLRKTSVKLRPMKLKSQLRTTPASLPAASTGASSMNSPTSSASSISTN